MKQVAIVLAFMFAGCSQARTEPAKPPAKLRFVAADAPCAPERATMGPLGSALVNRDGPALEGLLARGKVIMLLKGVTFSQQDTEDGFSWGFVRSGREIGRDCYIPTAFLQDTPPKK